MSNFKILFENPWLLLLVLPALALVLIPYFLSKKKYRVNRNRISSLVLRCVAMVLVVLLLAGMSISYTMPNEQNEVILVVDVSDSNDLDNQVRNQFISDLIQTKGNHIRMGIVTFGLDAVVAAELGYDSGKLYSQYLGAESPELSATNLEDALVLARDLFEHPETGKVILVSDGLETDGKARDVIRSLVAAGIRVDAMSVPQKSYTDEVQITDVQLPEDGVVRGQTFEMVVTLRSTLEGEATLTFVDESESAMSPELPTQIRLSIGQQEVVVPYTFSESGLHKLTFTVDTRYDTLAQNNRYDTYLFLEEFDDILIIEREDGQSELLKDILVKENYNVTVLGIGSSQLPVTTHDMQAYDQILLNNISVAEMPEGFAEALNEYVYEIGGGVFTIGGAREEGGKTVANAYNFSDTQLNSNKAYLDMLPVELIEYTPPLGVVIIIDRSGSMAGTPLAMAKEAALQCLSVLSERDWVGILTLEDRYEEKYEMTPVTQLSEIQEVINAIEQGGGTIYKGAIEAAAEMLNGLSTVQKKHIIVISDGDPSDNLWEDTVYLTGGYGGAVKDVYEKSGITVSFACLSSASAAADIQQAAEIGHGHYYSFTSGNSAELSNALAGDLKMPEIKDYIAEEFIPTIGTHTSVVAGIDPLSIPAMGGYYGSKLKGDATAVLMGDLVPLYASWRFGEGKVGSFMSDLNGNWSEKFLTDELGVGQQIVKNIVASLMPVRSVRSNDIEVVIDEQNYTNNVSIYTQVPLAEGESIRITVTPPEASESTDLIEQQQVIYPSATAGYSRAEFRVRTRGVHTILVEKLSAEGQVLLSHTVYRALTYSREYDTFRDAYEGQQLLADLTGRGEGALITSIDQAFDGFEDLLRFRYDPTLVLAITLIVLLLADVAVRKFKFKWIHEIIAFRKREKLLRSKGGRK